MKNSVLLALTVAVMDIIAVAGVISASNDPNEKLYSDAISSAETYASQNLCEKAIVEYKKAEDIKDSADVRLKIAELYEKGYETGEFSSIEGKVDTLEKMIEQYPKDERGYDELIAFHESQKDYGNCAEYVKLARKNKIETETVSRCYELLRRMYNVSPCRYDDIISTGTSSVAVRKVVENTEVRNPDGSYVYEKDDNGNEKIKMKEYEYTEYTFFKMDGTREEPVKAVQMTEPVSVTFSNGESHKYYFVKNYGNDLQLYDVSDKIYLSIVSDKLRNMFIGEDQGYEPVGSMNSGFITLKNTKTGKYDIFNSSGKEYMTGLDNAGSFSNNVVYIEKDGQKGIYNSKGNKILDGEVDSVILALGSKCSLNQRGFVKFKGDSAYKMIDFTKNASINFECDNADLFVDDMAAFEKNGKWGFVSIDGDIKIEPQYEEARSFSNGFAAVKKNGKWGIIDTFNEMIVEPKYEDVLYFDKYGRAFVYSEEEGWGFLELIYNEAM